MGPPCKRHSSAKPRPQTELSSPCGRANHAAVLEGLDLKKKKNDSQLQPVVHLGNIFLTHHICTQKERKKKKSAPYCSIKCGIPKYIRNKIYYRIPKPELIRPFWPLLFTSVWNFRVTKLAGWSLYIYLDPFPEEKKFSRKKKMWILCARV